MKELLEEHGHELRVVSGSPPIKEMSKGDNVITSNNYCIVEKSIWLFSGKLHILRNFCSHILWADFIITEQANKHLHNYVLIMLRLIGVKYFGYWGHGRNRQGRSNSIKERVKKALSLRCDWWFAYTGGVGEYMKSLGFPSSKITVLNNSVDTSEFKGVLDSIGIDEISSFKKDLEIDSKARIGLYCGAIYAEKKIGFLLNAAIQVHHDNPDFILLIVGDGAERYLVEDFAKQHSFVRYLGPLFGASKALAFKSSEVFLCPGLVGLAILDAFASALPIFTTDIPYHSPEIEYLQNYYNGIMVEAREDCYAQTVIRALMDLENLEKLKHNAYLSSNLFSIDKMAHNFVNGIIGYIVSREISEG
ncbi:glycosyltransferase family 4 protein [Methylomonas sp. EbB]|uniref:Glycosyltransferase family 4 protein n=2 Tax=Methylomonas fluvii TaxID=1854564 RepID=A0ABR9D9T1_9GAMM|nr:glycosyltransferase family 4 protein [Methylomonas fluvii]MBD9359868.1 glycosyltransferase family 4 protein [Methylomonas fluvii]